ncbi:unnamed protein product [Pedinophyceae sp. YPF-701]|nr:unnamed protein product [Pedinophyceae sp. YPF-701]
MESLTVASQSAASATAEWLACKKAKPKDVDTVPGVQAALTRSRDVIKAVTSAREALDQALADPEVDSIAVELASVLIILAEQLGKHRARGSISAAAMARTFKKRVLECTEQLSALTDQLDRAAAKPAPARPATGDAPLANDRAADSEPDGPAVPPPDLLCSICCDVMADPVLLVDSGQTYCRLCIEEWIRHAKIPTDPKTRQRVQLPLRIVTNYAMRGAVDALPAGERRKRETAAAMAAARAAADAAANALPTHPGPAGGSHWEVEEVQALLDDASVPVVDLGGLEVKWRASETVTINYKTLSVGRALLVRRPGVVLRNGILRGAGGVAPEPHEGVVTLFVGEGAKGFLMDEVVVREGAGDGVYVAGAQGVSIRRCWMEGNGTARLANNGHGLVVRDGAEVRMEAGCARGNGRGVLVLGGGSRLHAAGVESSRNVGHGIYVRDGARLSVEGGESVGNGGDGLWCFNRAVASCRNLEAGGNDGSGVFAQYLSKVTLEGGGCRDNGASGAVAMNEGTMLTVVDVACVLNGAYGLDASDYAKVTVKGVDLSGNKKGELRTSTDAFVGKS